MYRILCFGDSITYGTCDEKSLGWPGRLRINAEKSAEGNRVFNLGIGGETTKQLLERINSECEARIDLRKNHEYIITIATGTNDAKGTPNLLTATEVKIKLEEYEFNLKKIIATAQTFTKNIYVIGLTPVDEKRTNPIIFASGPACFSNKIEKAFNKTAKEVAKKMNAKFIDLIPEFEKLDYSKLLAEGAHPNSKGYDLMFDIIKKELRV